jgi:hypothetical protein
MIADKLSPNANAAVNLAMERTFAQTNEERICAQVAIYRATHVDSAQIAWLTDIGMKAIRDERARQQRMKADRAQRLRDAGAP